MAFYWVNLGDSYKEVKENKFLWAPAYSINKAGKKTVTSGWKSVPLVKRGDIIFCHRKREIIYTAIAKQDAFASDRPKSREFDRWKNDGYKIDVELEILDTPFGTGDLKQTLILLHNDNCTPKLYGSNNNATQNYMTELPDAAGALILNAIGNYTAIPKREFLKQGGLTKPPPETEREAISKYRIGQSKFREKVLKLWNHTCPITGVNTPELLIASHIVSWQLANNKEKLDQFNGLPLSPSIDKLFDKGFVSFDDNGGLLINPNICKSTVEKLGIAIDSKIANLQPEHRKYLKRHRDSYGISEIKKAVTST